MLMEYPLEQDAVLNAEGRQRDSETFPWHDYNVDQF